MNMIRNFGLQMHSFLDYFSSVKTKYGAMTIITTPVIIIATTCIVYRFAKRTCKGKDEVVFARSMSVGALHGGKIALERLIDFHHARADSASLNAAEAELKSLLAEEHPDFNKLQSVVAKLEMSGKELIGVDILERAVEKARKESKPHEAYEIEMLLVEMLIYKGDYEKALNCECLSHEEISDARRPLYKAIIYIMLDHPKEEAAECWEEFTEVRTHFQSPLSFQEVQIDEGITDFNQFVNVAKMLKQDVKKAHIRRLQSTKT